MKLTSVIQVNEEEEVETFKAGYKSQYLVDEEGNYWAPKEGVEIEIPDKDLYEPWPNLNN